MTRTLSEGGNDIIFNEYNFEDVFYNDVSGAVKSIAVSSPYLRERSVKTFIRNTELMQDVEITVFTKEPEEKNKAKSVRPVKLLEDAGIKVIVLPKLYQKFAVIDGITVWYGGVNLLGAGYSDESIMRIPGREIADELMRGVGC